MTLQAKLELSDIFSCDALIVQIKQLGPNHHRVDILEAHWEEHLAVAVQLLKHV